MSAEDKVYVGKVIWFKKNYGFIGWEKDGAPQTDLFVHFSDCVMPSSEDYKTLKKDAKVEFKVGLNVRGQPKAVEVKTITS